MFASVRRPRSVPADREHGQTLSVGVAGQRATRHDNRSQRIVFGSVSNTLDPTVLPRLSVFKKRIFHLRGL